jgi:cytochrome oxidase assembly protein ShyY1
MYNYNTVSGEASRSNKLCYGFQWFALQVYLFSIAWPVISMASLPLNTAQYCHMFKQ